MSGFSRMYVIGGAGGYMGADGVNPIELLILVGDAHRQWLEPHYFNRSIRPMGRLQTIVPFGPDHPDMVLDACLAFYPRPFRRCPSFRAVEAAVRGMERLDFDARPDEIPAAWPILRAEARGLLAELGVWEARFLEFDVHKNCARVPGDFFRESAPRVAPE
jgi:hypothetical protein